MVILADKICTLTNESQVNCKVRAYLDERQCEEQTDGDSATCPSEPELAHACYEPQGDLGVEDVMYLRCVLCPMEKQEHLHDQNLYNSGRFTSARTPDEAKTSWLAAWLECEVALRFECGSHDVPPCAFGMCFPVIR